MVALTSSSPSEEEQKWLDELVAGGGVGARVAGAAAGSNVTSDDFRSAEADEEEWGPAEAE